MYGVLDLTWTPTAAAPTPPAGKAPAIVRGDTYVHTIVAVTGDDPFPIDGALAASIRPAVLTGTTTDDPIAEFAVDIDDNRVTISLTPAETQALPAAMARQSYRWDLQWTLDDDTVTTLLAGRVKCVGDVTRPNP